MDGTRLVRVFFGTSREVETDERNARRISNKTGDTLTAGYCTVSIPPSHKLGEVERPFWLLSAKPTKHFMLTEVFDYDPEELKRLIAKEFREGASPRALVYVHGVTNGFQDAAFRAAQLKNDLSFEGPVAFFSWPSGSSMLGYSAARESAEWSSAHLADFLKLIMTQTVKGDVVVIAHSMGTRLTAHALARLGEQKKRVREIILASPDIDAKIFERDIAPVLSRQSERVTIYTSGNDLALRFSGVVNDATRVGGGLALKAPFDVIDTSKVSGTFLGHADYTEARPALTDLSYLVNLQLPPEKRAGLRRTAGSTYWEMLP